MSDILEITEKLDKTDRKLVERFVNTLLSKDKYRKLRREIEARRNEAKTGKTLSHDEFWKKIDV